VRAGGVTTVAGRDSRTVVARDKQQSYIPVPEHAEQKYVNGVNREQISKAVLISTKQLMQL